MFESILVPLDGSPAAEQALQYATLLGACEGAPLHLVRVVSPYPLTGMHDALTYLERIAPPSTATTVRSGSPAAEILAVAEELPRPVIVIADHGRSGGRRRSLGHVVDRVVHHASNPVLLVRTDTRGAPRPTFDPILLPLDDAVGADDAVLSLAAHLARRFDAALRLVPLVERPSICQAMIGDPAFGGAGTRIELWETLNASAEHAAERCLLAARPALQFAGVMARTRVLQAMSIDELLAYKRVSPPGLVVIEMHGKGRVNRYFHRGIVEQLLSRGTAPILLIRPRSNTRMRGKEWTSSHWLRPAVGRATP